MSDAEEILTSAEEQVAATKQYVAHSPLLRARGIFLRDRGDLLAGLEVLVQSAEVARLLARGHTNREIAGALVIAEGTAGVHVDHILSKLGFRSRAQVAAWAIEHGLLAESN